MRVLMTTDTVGGVWTFTRELTEGLLAQNCSVLLVSFGRDPSPDQQAWADRLRDRSARQFQFVPTTFPLEWMQNNHSFYAASSHLLQQLARDTEADLLHSNQLCYGALAEQLPTLVTVHSDVRSWFTACRGSDPEPSPWISQYDHLVGRGLKSANAVVAPTAWMLAEAERNYGPFRDAAVVPNGRDLTPPLTAPSARRMQAVTVGRLWDEAKDVAFLSRLASPMPLLVAGEAVGPDAAASVAGSGVQWLGHLSETGVLDLFRQSPIYVVTSLYEPFGLAPLEAALCGCALLLRDLPSLREVWGDAGAYFRNPSELSDHLHRMHAHPQHTASMGRLAHARAQSYSRQTMTELYLQRYSALCGAHRGANQTERHVA